ncbi:hypothetical protein IWZ03DRAFT_390403 [Phyllosticta citriasiana]|uniref:Uncharacterized protein n=1 Tax=Phyllosticta citriasiana TaxID=595635 RepID=A0ABR1K800_9PEZI
MSSQPHLTQSPHHLRHALGPRTDHLPQDLRHISGGWHGGGAAAAAAVNDALIIVGVIFVGLAAPPLPLSHACNGGGELGVFVRQRRRGSNISQTLAAFFLLLLLDILLRLVLLRLYPHLLLSTTCARGKEVRSAPFAIRPRRVAALPAAVDDERLTLSSFRHHCATASHCVCFAALFGWWI